MSKRNIRRQIKHEKEVFVKKFMDAGLKKKSELCVETESGGLCVESIVDSNTEENIRHFEYCNANDLLPANDTRSLNEKLRNWFIKYRPSRECAQNLYKILQEENLNVENFYKTKNAIEPNIVAIAGGSYLAIGVATQLKKFSDYVALPEKLSLDVNIDGLPLFRSSKTQLWPVLLRLKNVYSCPVFPVGIYMGRSKPNL